MKILADLLNGFFAVAFFFCNGEIFFCIRFVSQLAKAVCIIPIKSIQLDFVTKSPTNMIIATASVTSGTIAA